MFIKTKYEYKTLKKSIRTINSQINLSLINPK